MTIAFNPTAANVVSDTERTQIVFVHVGKCAGETILTELSKLPSDRFAVSEFHCFDANKKIEEILDSDRENIIYVIARRDPVARFVSAFNWDKHNLHLKGVTTGNEKLAFENFLTPDGLASSLSAPDEAERELAQRLRSFGHMGMGQSWYTPASVASRLPAHRSVVLDVETLGENIKSFLRFVGSTIPDTEWTPKKYKSDYAKNYADGDMLFQTALSPLARSNLLTSLKEDFEVYNLLGAMRERLVEKPSHTPWPISNEALGESQISIGNRRASISNEVENDMNELEKSIENVRKPWIGSRYYGDAEKWTYLFWEEKSSFKKLFDRLSKRTMIELACGHGRHAENTAAVATKLTLVDVIEENLLVCRDRLQEFNNLQFKLGNGAEFPDTRASSTDSIYCYDAMVHFSPDIVESYLKDTARVLRKGGCALYHHSNYADGKDKGWGTNPHARNYMTRELFASIAEQNGLQVLEQIVIPWGGVPELDCISLVGKP